MSKENETRTNSTLTKCVVKPSGSCGAELTTRDAINFQKLVAQASDGQTTSDGPDQI